MPFAPPSSRLLAFILAVVALAGGSHVLAQTAIYSCTDAQGRRLTSDRPIPACIDREQKQLNPSGTVKRTVPPTPTATEYELQQLREREAALQRQRERDAFRRDQALIARYPNQAAHDADRAKALEQSGQVAKAIEKRLAELDRERKALGHEMEFYAANPAKAPAKVRRAIADNAKAIEEQKSALVSQREGQQRINARFDEEALQLKDLWDRMAPLQLPGK